MDLYFQGIELRMLKSVTLGQKKCETKELFSANPQLMTVSINTNGSLKLSVIIIWKYVTYLTVCNLWSGYQYAMYQYLTSPQNIIQMYCGFFKIGWIPNLHGLRCWVYLRNWWLRILMKVANWLINLVCNVGILFLFLVLWMGWRRLCRTSMSPSDSPAPPGGDQCQ